MIPLLKPIFQDALAPHGEGLALIDRKPETATLVADLINNPQTLLRLLQRHALHLGVRDADLRAAASAWSMAYLQILLPPVSIAATILRHPFPVSAEQIALQCDYRSAPRKFFITDPGVNSRDADTAALYNDLLWRHLQPLFAAIRGVTHLPMKILWGNTARYLAVVLEEARRITPHHQHIRADRSILLDSPQWPDGRANPLYPRLHTPFSATDTTPSHRQCCLNYRLPGETWCKRCPLAPWLRLRDSAPRAGAVDRD